jgi:hypothetical protein
VASDTNSLGLGSSYFPSKTPTKFMDIIALTSIGKSQYQISRAHILCGDFSRTENSVEKFKGSSQFVGKSK